MCWQPSPEESGWHTAPMKYSVIVPGIEACSKTSLMTEPRCDPRRDEDGGHADAEAIEVEGIGRAGGAGLGDESIVACRRAAGRGRRCRRARRRRPAWRCWARGWGCCGCVVDRGDELLAGADVVVGMLIAGDQFAGAVGRVVIGVVGLDEAVLGKLIVIAGVEEVLECAEERGLVLQEVDDFEGGAGFVVVIELAWCARRRRGARRCSGTACSSRRRPC